MRPPSLSAEKGDRQLSPNTARGIIKEWPSYLLKQEKQNLNKRNMIDIGTTTEITVLVIVLVILWGMSS